MSNFTPFPIPWKKSDFAFFFLFIPALLTLMYLLPLNLKNDLILHTSNPNILSIFFSNYMHSNLTHIFENLLSYLLVMFILFNLETNKKRFYRTSGLIFILLPFISSWAAMQYIDLPGGTQGFSALVSAFCGYLIYSVYCYLKQVHFSSLQMRFVLLVIMINVSFMATNVGADTLYLFSLWAITGSMMYLNRRELEAIFSMLNLKLKNANFKMDPLDTIYYASACVYAFLFLFVLPILIPASILVDGHVVNILSHYIGWVFGIVVGIGLK